MNAASDVLLVAAALCALCGGIVSAMIAGELQKRGIKVNWFLLRVLIAARYLGQYRDLTCQETGRPGPLYRVFIVSMNPALVMAIAGLLLRAA
jgi:hypothetical protein